MPDFTPEFASALEEAYKKDNQGFESLEAFAAHTIAEMIETGLLRQANAFNTLAHKPEVAPAFFGCKNAVEWMLWNIESSIREHSGIDDFFADSIGLFIDEHSK